MSNAKSIVQRYFDMVLGGAPADGLPQLFADHVRWFVPRANPIIKTNPTLGRAAVMELLGSGVGVYEPGSFKLLTLKLIAEGDEVAAFFTLSAKLANGKAYENDYAFYFRVEGQQIAEVREHLESYYQYTLGVFDGYI